MQSGRSVTGDQDEEQLFFRCRLLFEQSSLLHPAYLFRDREADEMVE
jgi:hypothetical protein